MFTLTNAHGRASATSLHSRLTSSYVPRTATTFAPYVSVAMIFARSRSSGTNTYAGIRACAAAAAVAFARLPVDAHDIASNPKARAFVVATETTRSLNEFEGLTESSLTHSGAVN